MGLFAGQVGERTIKVGAAVAEDSPFGARGGDFGEIEFGGDNGVVFVVQPGDDFACGAGDERPAIEAHFDFVAESVFLRLHSNPVCGGKGGHVCGGVSAHCGFPMIAGAPVGGVGFVADGGGIQQDFRAAQGEDAGAFGKPLVPANGGADFNARGLHGVESGVAGAEVEFFLIAGSVGDVGLAVEGGDVAAWVDNGEGVESRLAGELIEGDGEDDLELGGDLAQTPDGGIVVDGLGPGERLGDLGFAEIGALEQFRQQDDMGAVFGGAANEIFGARQIFLRRAGKGGLDNRNADNGHVRRPERDGRRAGTIQPRRRRRRTRKSGERGGRGGCAGNSAWEMSGSGFLRQLGGILKGNSTTYKGGGQLDFFTIFLF